MDVPLSHSHSRRSPHKLSVLKLVFLHQKIATFFEFPLPATWDQKSVKSDSQLALHHLGVFQISNLVFRGKSSFFFFFSFSFSFLFVTVSPPPCAAHLLHLAHALCHNHPILSLLFVLFEFFILFSISVDSSHQLAQLSFSTLPMLQ